MVSSVIHRDCTNSTRVLSDQCSMWQDTMDESPITEQDATSGGIQPVSMNEKLLHDIQVCVSRLVTKSPQLIGNFTINLAEGWMNIRCKLDGGKVINRSQSGSWDLRCMGAGLHQNIGPVWGPKALSEMTSTAINPVYQSVTDSYAKKIASDRKRKATPAAKGKASILKLIILCKLGKLTAV